MPVLNSNEGWSLEELVAIHGLTDAQDKEFAIEGIAIDLDISPEEARDLLIVQGYLKKDS